MKIKPGNPSEGRLISSSLLDRIRVSLESGNAYTDKALVRLFLRAYEHASPHTIRAYRKECLKFLVWLRWSRQDLTNEFLLRTVHLEDAQDYMLFLSSPPTFVDQSLAKRFNRLPLNEKSRIHARSVLHKFFEALRNVEERGEPVMRLNPFHLVSFGSRGDSFMPTDKAFSNDEMQTIWGVIDNMSEQTPKEKEHKERARWVFSLLYLAFLRRSEAASLRMRDFRLHSDGWCIHVVGKGRKHAVIVASDELIDALARYRSFKGLSPLPGKDEDIPAILPIVNKRQKSPMSDQTIYLICKMIFDQAGLDMTSSRFEHATPHWMRHTSITHSLEAGTPPRYVQAQARHSSLNVTSMYDHTNRKNWRAALKMK